MDSVEDAVAGARAAVAAQRGQPGSRILRGGLLAGLWCLSSVTLLCGMESSDPTPRSRIRPPEDAVLFGGHWYTVVPRRVSWSSAAEQCEARGGHLVCVESAGENAFLARLVGGSAVWLGVRRPNPGDAWQWVTGQPLGFTDWQASAAPDDGQGKGAYAYAGEDGHWRDVPADSPLRHGFVCEWDPPLALTPAQLHAALKEANPGYDGRGSLSLRAGTIVGADLADTGPIRNLEPLRGLPLESLALGGAAYESPLEDLKPLGGMPLATLAVQGCARLRDLGLLQTLPLTTLRLLRTPVDLRQLRGLPPTKMLHIENAKIIDLAPLQGMQITRLALINVKPVSDIRPLAGMPLVELTLAQTHVWDLKPLQGMRLESLNLAGTQVFDLTPLAGMPLKRLAIEDSRVQNLDALVKTPIEVLTFTPRSIRTGLGVLRGIRTLREIGTASSPRQARMDVETFWEKYYLGAFD